MYGLVIPKYFSYGVMQNLLVFALKAVESCFQVISLLFCSCKSLNDQNRELSGAENAEGKLSSVLEVKNRADENKFKTVCNKYLVSWRLII